MDIHVWKGRPEAPLASCCGAKNFTISKMTESYAEGTITAIDHIEHDIEFTDSWEATLSEKDGWLVSRKDDETAFWKNRETGKVYFTLNSKIDASIEKFIAERIEFFLKTNQKRIGPIRTNKESTARALKEMKLFKVRDSFVFAVQIPDDSVGCSGSRCSNCDNSVAYCNQRCLWCGFPFIGPSGFPQIMKWRTLPAIIKNDLVEAVYMRRNKGRLGYSNVAFVPLTSKELEIVESLKGQAAEYFLSTHSISTEEIRKTLLK